MDIRITETIKPDLLNRPIQSIGYFLLFTTIVIGQFLTSAVFIDFIPAKCLLIVMSAGALFSVYYITFTLLSKYRNELSEDSYYVDPMSGTRRKPVHEEGKMRTNTLKARTSATTRSGRSGWMAGLNLAHPNHAQIKARLTEIGVTVHDGFVGPLDRLPNKWVILISSVVPFDDIKKLLEAVYDLEFDGFRLIDTNKENGEVEDIYLGGYFSGDFTMFTPDFPSRLSAMSTLFDLKLYMRGHIETSTMIYRDERS